MTWGWVWAENSVGISSVLFFFSSCVTSGFGGAVQIYDTSSWSSEPQKVPPLFVHRGHSVSSQPGDDVVVTSHLWHPERPRTLLSAASDASVHVWDWNDQSAASWPENVQETERTNGGTCEEPRDLLTRRISVCRYLWPSFPAMSSVSSSGRRHLLSLVLPPNLRREDPTT